MLTADALLSKCKRPKHHSSLVSHVVQLYAAMEALTLENREKSAEIVNLSEDFKGLIEHIKVSKQTTEKTERMLSAKRGYLTG
jgi:phage head maturation protease